MISIRPVEEADLETLFEYQSDPVAVAMAFFGGGRERDAFMARWSKALADPDSVARAVEVDGRLAGDVVSWTGDGRRYIAYWIGREFWGRGVATEAVREFIADLARPLSAWVVSSNTGSRRVLEKSGFVPADPQPPPMQTEVPELLYVLVEPPTT